MTESIDFGLNSTAIDEIYRTYLLDGVDKEHLVTYTFHTRYRKNERITLRKFQLSCLANLIHFDPDSKAEEFVVYTYILEFLDSFLTEDAMNPNKVSDDRMIDFFAHAYEVISHSYPEGLNRLFSNINALSEYDPEIFNTQKHPDFTVEIAKFIAHLREKGLNVSNDIYRNYYSAHFGPKKSSTQSKEKEQEQKSEDEKENEERSWAIRSYLFSPYFKR